MVLNSSPSKRPMGGQPKSEASSLSSAEVRRLWEEPTEAIPQNQREAAGILFLLGRGGCQRTGDGFVLLSLHTGNFALLDQPAHIDTEDSIRPFTGTCIALI